MEGRYCINEWRIVRPFTGETVYLYQYNDGSWEWVVLK